MGLCTLGSSFCNTGCFFYFNASNTGTAVDHEKASNRIGAVVGIVFILILIYGVIRVLNDHYKKKHQEELYRQWFNALPTLIPCPDCEKEVSKHAGTCPHCGCIIVEKTWTFTSVGFLFE